MLRVNQRTSSKIAAVPVPVGGWDAVSPISEMRPEYALRLDNWFPREGYLELRKGFDLHASPGGPSLTDAVETLMVWQGPAGTNALFAAVTDTIWNVTTTLTPIEITSVSSFGSARFQWTNFTTSGGSFLWACNGSDAPVYYDGSTWASATITGVTSTDIIHVTPHRGRLWLTLKNSTKAAYLPLDSIQGAAVTFDLGGVFNLGGYLMAIDTWSRDGGDGPDDYLCFISSRGQVAVYSMIDPGDSGGVYLVGVYRLGAPIGRRCTERIGPDLAVISIDGVQSLSQASALDRAAQARATITRRVQPAINASARLSAEAFGWQFIAYPKGQMAILNVPLSTGAVHQYVLNVLTGAWCRFTGQKAYCWALMGDRLFFGGDGWVLEADVGGADFGGGTLTADVRFPFSYYGERGRKKRWTMAQPIMETNISVLPSIGCDVDFTEGAALDAVASAAGADVNWNEFNWNEANWPGGLGLSDEWVSISGLGYAASIRLVIALAGRPYGEELLANATFADWTTDDPDDWTVTGEAGSNIVTEGSPGAQLVSDDGTEVGIEQAVMTAGKRYRVTIVVSDVSGGGIQYGSGDDLSETIAAAGTFTREVLATAGDGTKATVVTADAAPADVTITSVSVKEILVEGEAIGEFAELKLLAMNVVHEGGGFI